MHARLHDKLIELMDAVIRFVRRLVESPGRCKLSIAVQHKQRSNAMVEVKLSTIEQAVVTITPVDAQGKPAPVQNVTWGISSGDGTGVLGALQPSEDGLTCVIPAGDTPGTAQVTITADADPGEGIVNIVELIDFTVTHAFASNLGVTVVVQPKPVV